MTTITKSLGDVRIKDAAKGQIEAVFSTFGVIDHDGDVTHKSAFTEGAPVVISAYGHMSWAGELPVGKGSITLTDDEAILVGEFFMDTTHGRDTFLTVKALSEGAGLQQWSYSLDQIESEPTEVDGRKARLLTKIHVDEVSPVLKGASIGTRTLEAKSAKTAASATERLLRDVAHERWADDETSVWLEDWDPDEKWAVFDVAPSDGGARLLRVEFASADDAASVTLGESETEVQRTVNYAPKGAKFLEQATTVLADVDTLTTRATEVVALRAAKGKGIAAESADVLTRLDAAMQRLKALLTAPPTDNTDDAIARGRELLRSIAHNAQGVTL